MGLLDKIVAQKRREVEQAKDSIPIAALAREAHYTRSCVSLSGALETPGASGVIAELKRKSPSKGELKMDLSIAEVSTGYAAAGATALSILTDTEFFGGSNQDVRDARALNHCPILRKEFIVDPYQVHEAKAIGADVILLIARLLDARELKLLAQTAVDLGLEVLCEVHEESELERSLIDQVQLLGINSRNLDTLAIDLASFERIGASIPDSKVRIAESGISDAQVVRSLRAKGFSGFLIGENFMKTPDPAAACRAFIGECR